MAGTARELQVAVALAGYWLDEDTAVRLAEERRHGLPLAEVQRQVEAAARPLTPSEKAAIDAARGRAR